MFPEASIVGYPRYLDFGTRTDAGRDDFPRYRQAAIAVPGPETDRIGSFAVRMRAHLVIGVIARDGAMPCRTARFFGPERALPGKHRRLMPTASERRVRGFGFGAGAAIPRPSAPRSAGSVRRSAGETTCPTFGRPCMPRGSRCDARQRWTSATFGRPRCAISPMRAASSCCPPDAGGYARRP